MVGVLSFHLRIEIEPDVVDGRHDVLVRWSGVVVGYF
jgi:hypothetical protein